MSYEQELTLPHVQKNVNVLHLPYALVSSNFALIKTRLELLFCLHKFAFRIQVVLFPPLSA